MNSLKTYIKTLKLYVLTYAVSKGASRHSNSCTHLHKGQHTGHYWYKLFPCSMSLATPPDCPQYFLQSPYRLVGLSVEHYSCVYQVQQMSLLVNLCTVTPVDFVTVIIFWIVGGCNHYPSNTTVSPHSIRLENKMLL